MHRSAPATASLGRTAGTGTVSRRLLAEAGVASVLAVDRDVRFLEHAPPPASGRFGPTSPPPTSRPDPFSSSTPGS